MPDGAAKHRAIYQALKEGRAVASNGPLLVFEVNGHKIGDEVEVVIGGEAKLDIQWALTPEMGTMQKIKVIRNSQMIEEILVDRLSRAMAKYRVTESGYFRLEGRTDRKNIKDVTYQVYANPIWIKAVEPRIIITSSLQVTPSPPTTMLVRPLQPLLP